ncbi:hypothetical protein EJB05_20883, partial [Eragrostis curvula]
MKQIGYPAEFLFLGVPALHSHGSITRLAPDCVSSWQGEANEKTKARMKHTLTGLRSAYCYLLVSSKIGVGTRLLLIHCSIGDVSYLYLYNQTDRTHTLAVSSEFCPDRSQEIWIDTELNTYLYGEHDERLLDIVHFFGYILYVVTVDKISIMWQQFAANCLEQDDMVSKIVERNYKAAEIKVALTCSRSASWPCALL